MKTLTTLTAIAALVVGMSIASAQTSPPNTMDKGASGTKTTPAPQAAIGTGKFCLATAPGSALNCKYASLDACQKDATPLGQQCSPNPNSGTTGSK